MAQNVTLVLPDGNEPRETLNVTDSDVVNFDVAFDMPRPPPPPPQQQQQQQVAFDMPRPPPHPVPQRPPQPAPPQPDELNDFANPNKIDDSPDLDLDNESPMQDDFMDDLDNDFGGGGYQQPQAPPAIQPLPPFETLEDERADLMYKLQRAARTGVQVRSFGWNADIREMRAEVGRAKAEQEVDASIAFQRQIMMTLCTGIEYANKRFAYLDLELDGWSENIMDDINKFDTVFEKLHKKHAGRMNIPPELQLVFMIGGSAMTWHLVAKSRKSRDIEEKKKEERKSKKRKSRRRDVSDSESERSRMRRKYSRPNNDYQQQQQQPGPREMRGPGFDVGGMMGGMGGMGGLAGLTSMLPPVPVPDLAPRNTRQAPQLKQPQIRDVDSSRSTSPDESPDESPRRNARSPSVESERLSDIPSEELGDIPSDFGASPADMSPEEEMGGGTRLIPIEEPKRKGRPKKNNQAKKVVII